MLKQLQTFLAVCQYGSFATAGHHIGLTQSAVSSQIKQLEQELGYHLFDRSGQRAVLTPQAEQILPQIKHIISQFHELKYLSSYHSLQGHLTIGTITSVQTGILPDVLMTFFKQAPHAHINIKSATSMQLLSMLEQMDIDVAFMLKPPFSLPKHFYIKEICQQNYVLITPNHIQSTNIDEILIQYPLIRYDALSLGGREIDIFLEQYSTKNQEILIIDDIEAIIAMIERGLGVAILPNAGLWKTRQANVNIISLGDNFYRTICLIIPYRHRKLPLIQLLINILDTNNQKIKSMQ